MTEFSSVVEFRAALQRQFDALDELLRANRAAIVSTEREQEMVALQIATVDRVMAMQPTLQRETIEAAAMYVEEWRIDETKPPNPNAQKIAEQTAPRQRADVRGPVLALIRNSATELSADEICALLPDLRPASVRAALNAAVRMHTIAEDGGLYFLPGRLYPASAPPTPKAALAPGSDAGPNSSPQDDRQGEDSDRHPAALVEQADTAGLNPAAQGRDGSSPSGGTTERSVPRYPNTFAHTTEPDPRALANDTPEEQARALRAAIELAGSVGVDEDNACVAPDVIAAGIAAGWLSRGEDDKGIMRLRIAEQQEAE